MPDLILLKDSEKYGGRFVALRSFQNKKVVSSGTDPAEVCAKARKKGVKDPVIFYVPKKGMVHIY